MSLKGKIEAIIYAAEEPVTLDQIATLLREPVLAELANQPAPAATEADTPVDNTEGMPSEAVAPTETAMAETTPVEPPVGTPEQTAETEAVFTETAPADESTTVPGEAAAAESVEVSAEPAAPPEQSAEVPEQTAVAEGASAEVTAAAPVSRKKVKDPELAAVKARLRELLAELIADYESDQRGIEIRQIAGGYRMATKPEHHDVVVGFAKSLKPPIRLSLPALETLAVIAYKQPVTLPEVSEIRGVDSSGVVATLLDRKLVTTAGRKQVVGRPMLYKTTKEFLLRFGLKDVSELPSMEEFEKLREAELFDPNATEAAITIEAAEANAEAAQASQEGTAAAENAPDTPPAHETQPAVQEAPAAEQQPAEEPATPAEDAAAGNS